MLPVIQLAVVGGAAALELGRLIKRGGGGDDEEHRQKVNHLRRALQEAQKELDQEQRERRAREEALQRLASEKDNVEKEAEQLREENAAVHAHAEALLDRFSVLEEAAGNLQTENEGLSQQMEALKVDNQQRASELEKLKEDVGEALQQFNEGSLAAEALVAQLQELGVEIRFSAKELSHLTSSAEFEPTERLAVCSDEAWTQQLHLITASPQRMARLMAAGAAREGLAGASVPALAFPSARTPPKQPMSARLFDNMPAAALHAFTPRSAAASAAQLALHDQENAIPTGLLAAATANRQAAAQLTAGGGLDEGVTVSPGSTSLFFLPGAKKAVKVRGKASEKPRRANIPKLPLAPLSQNDIASTDVVPV